MAVTNGVKNGSPILDRTNNDEPTIRRQQKVHRPRLEYDWMISPVVNITTGIVTTFFVGPLYDHPSTGSWFYTCFTHTGWNHQPKLASLLGMYDLWRTGIAGPIHKRFIRQRTLSMATTCQLDTACSANHLPQKKGMKHSEFAIDKGKWRN